MLELNQAWVPHVGPVDEPRLAALVAGAGLALVAVGADGALAGFLIALGPGADYDSPNYRWFSGRHDRFTYVDRVAVSAAQRGAGLGRRLYRAVAEHAAAEGSPVVCAEVNLEPPNPGSSAFHAAMGFVPVGTQWTSGGKVRVELLEWRP
jgi:hypothetical protein